MVANQPDVGQFLRGDAPAVEVRIAKAKGSVPRGQGTWMLVAEDRIFRTIGGGQLEYLAIDKARVLLRKNTARVTLTVPLGPEIGQCCGGRVSLTLERVTEDRRKELIEELDAETGARPEVYIFGAGHVGRALAACMSLLPVRAVLVDTRSDELNSAPAGTETCLTAIPESLVRDAAPGSAFVILTHDHALDFLITREALERGDAAYVGLIGSRTKRATFRSWIGKEAVALSALGQLVCPIGGNSTGDKRPEVIAAFVTAEIMEALARAQGNGCEKTKLSTVKSGAPEK